MSKSYDTDIEVPVNYINAPEDKVVVNDLPPLLTLNVTSTGWELLKDHVRAGRHLITMDISRFSKDSHLNSTANLVYLDRQLPSVYSLNRVSPGSLEIAFDEKKIRTVPVCLNHRLTLDPQFNFSDS